MSEESRNTDLTVFMNDLDGGVFAETVGRVLSDVAAAVILNERKGKVCLTFDMELISGNTSQVQVSHKLHMTKPTAKGKSTDEATTSTPMYVGRGGKLSIFQPNQSDWVCRGDIAIQPE